MFGLIILLATALLLLILLVTAVVVRTLICPPRRSVGGAIARGLPTDPGEAGAAFETHTIESGDGVPMELWVVAGDDPAGPVVVAMHGWAEGRLTGLLWLPLILPWCSSVVLYDLRGHGESRHRLCTFGVKESDDARRIIDWMAARSPDRPLAILGWSLGATVAMLAALDTRRVDAVIVDSPGRTPLAAVRAMVRLNGLPAWPVAELAFGLLSLMWRGLWSRDVAEIASRVTQPLLVLQGDGDTITPASEAHAVADAAPRGTWHSFPDAGHIQSAFLHPESYRETIVRFVAANVTQKKIGT
jgi:pimeloyl-ACP methyl ester carboxylesterase